MKLTNILGMAVYEELQCLNEINQIKEDPTIKKLIDNPNVKEFIALSKKKLAKKSLDKKDEQDVNNLLKTKEVQQYLEASKKVGERIGWIKGGITGASGGLLATSAIAGAAGLTMGSIAALGILGAIAGGLIVGYPTAKIKGILRRWKSEENMTKGGLESGMVFHR